MKFILPLMLALAMLSGCAIPSVKSTTPSPVIESLAAASYRQISMAEALVMMENEDDYIILDVRTADEFAEKHIPGAINIDNGHIGTEELPQLPDKEQLIMVYCRSGNRSKQASEKLVKLGYNNVVEFGGINEWPGETVSGN